MGRPVPVTTGYFVWHRFALPNVSRIRDVCAVASPRGGGGGQAGQLVPQPPIGHPVRSMQIRGVFRVRKNEVTLQDLLRHFTCTDAIYGGRSLVLRLRKKGELWKLLKELGTLVGSQ